MCGIIGIIGNNTAAPRILEGLRRLEYRGYDSAGIATVAEGKIHRVRAEGKLARLEAELGKHALPGRTGIGHTRWATHGAPNEKNAHPHATAQVAVVHNGIIENFRELKDRLVKAGRHFETDTDTEVVPVMVTELLEQGLSPQEAVMQTLRQLKGAFALGIAFAQHEGLLIAARKGSPLAVGFGDGEMYLGSDAIALAPYTQRICYLEEGDMAVLTREGAEIFDESGRKATREVRLTQLTGAGIGKGNFRHFMLKEIYEQPTVIGETLNAFTATARGEAALPELPLPAEKIEKITIAACGTSYYAGLVGKYWIESLARIPVEIETASEFRYRQPVLHKNGLLLAISQSGETADTLAALRYAKEHGMHTAAIVNVAESSMAMEAGAVLRTLAGPEIGVASTKAFTTQLTVLACLALSLARARKTLSQDQVAELTHALAEVPARASEVLGHDEAIAQLAPELAKATDMLYLGRGTSYPIAMEGALKLKEISYIHAEGYPAGEMKHGPIALVDENVPVVVIAPRDALFEKTASNMQEVAARGGKLILIGDRKSASELDYILWNAITLPEIHPFVAPILYAIPVQLLAYHTAVLKGTDVDQPRNLAKSVTVE